MKICFLAEVESSHAVRWINAMVNRGHDIHLVTMHDTTLHDIDYRVSVHKLKVPAPVGYYANWLEAAILVKKIKPDLLHVHYATGYGTLARLVNYKPALLSVWGSDVYLFPEQSRRNESIIRKNLAFVDRITSTSYAMKTQTEKFVKPASSIDVIPFGIDLNLFKPGEPKTNDSIVIGTIKRLKHVYGIDTLIKATAELIAYLRSNHFDDIAGKIRLMIVGEGPDLKELQQLAEKLQIGHITEFVGAVPNNQVPQYLNQLDVYCAFSRSESFGVAVLEASACEVPVVVSRVGGLPEVVKDEETGFMVEPDNVDDSVNKLARLVMDQEKRRLMGSKGREFVRNDYAWSRNVVQMEKVYFDMIYNKTN
ncbi:Glycosyltransferase involved in cell wall bisynthesis [Lentibacillus persicus]|uniref:Glycosyltransferase involved in cell wall bisynthesis n=1 Tax=Lentibacillus persicus TaxID=640948 RepID=A0A1I1VTC2_9BACI|nr:Glycosyltransferase involved in cell wall bisynthesis [Lentibacillus persicus]